VVSSLVLGGVVMGMSFRLVVVCLALWVSAVYGRDGAFLVVTRSVIDPEKPVREIPRGHQMWESYPGVVQGKEFAVAYEIRNLGNGYVQTLVHRGSTSRWRKLNPGWVRGGTGRLPR